MKKFILIFTLFFISLSTINAYSATVSEPIGTNFRDKPTTTSESIVIEALKYNTKVTIDDLTKYTGAGCDEGWYKVKYGTKEGYICSTYLSILNTTTDNGAYFTTSGYEARVSYTIVNTRKSSSASSSLVKTLMYGTQLKIINTFPKGNGCEDPWYNVSFHNNKTAYICSTYVTKYTDVAQTDFNEEDKAYCEALKTVGFPESYCPYLIKMHNKYPNWTFNPVITNLNWNNVIKGESSKNYITKTIDEDSYITSRTLLDGNAWYRLKDSVNAFYLDPRNFLNEKNIFMFETLTFDQNSSTVDNLTKMLSGTDLNTTAIKNNFIKYGKEFNVSAIHTASRVIQEGVTNSAHQGLSGTSTLTYREKKITGYYNLFNIGAFQDSYTNNPIARGLAFACGAINGGSTFGNCGTYTSYFRPWNSVENAIKGGTFFLGNDYISVGQYTLYFQKFNTANSGIDGASSNYTHQYMTNVQAPLNESFSMYSLYDGITILNTLNYSFSIPVYKDMPNEIISLPPIGDIVNTLSSLKVDDVTLSNFDKDIISYTKYIPSKTEKVNITATPSSSLSVVEGTGEYTITENETIIEVKVTNEINETKTYTITLIKTDEDLMSVNDLVNKLGVKVNENIVSIVAPNTKSNTILDKVSTNSVTAQAVLTDKNGKTKSKTSSLSTNDKLKITVMNGETKEFTILVLGDIDGNSKSDIIDLLKLKKHLLKTTKLSGTAIEASDVNSDNVVDILDLLIMKKYILGKVKNYS